MSDSIAEPNFRTVEISDRSYEHEGLRFVTVKSAALERRGDCVVWVPSMAKSDLSKSSEGIGTLLILLHGVYGSAWSWSLKAGVHRTAQRLMERGEICPVVIAMPSDSLKGDGSGYLTQPGCDVERWIVEEVPAIARLAARQLQPNARVGIAGLSMGAFGALRLGAKYAERFHAISAHSAITDIAEMEQFVEEPLDEFIRDTPRGELNVLQWILKERHRLPSLRFDCGIEDQLLGGNRLLHRALLAADVPHVYEEFQGGHEWPYWTEHVAATLRHVAAPQPSLKTKLR